MRKIIIIYILLSLCILCISCETTSFIYTEIYDQDASSSDTVDLYEFYLKKYLQENGMPHFEMMFSYYTDPSSSTDDMYMAVIYAECTKELFLKGYYYDENVGTEYVDILTEIIRSSLKQFPLSTSIVDSWAFLIYPYTIRNNELQKVIDAVFLCYYTKKDEWRKLNLETADMEPF